MRKEKLSFLKNLEEQIRKYVTNADILISEMYECLAIHCDNYVAYEIAQKQFDEWAASYNGEAIKARKEESLGQILIFKL